MPQLGLLSCLKKYQKKFIICATWKAIALWYSSSCYPRTLWDSEHQLWVYSSSVKHSSCSVDSAAAPFWGYNVLFCEPFCIPWTTSVRTACQTPEQVGPSTCPRFRHFPSTFLDSLLAPPVPSLVDATWCFPLMSCFPVGEQRFLGKGKWEKKTTLLSHFSQPNNDKTS